MDTKADSENVEYWKKQAKYYEQKANEIQHELDDYTENSAQLEKELEASLDQVEKQNRDLEHQNLRLKNEIEMLRNKLERSQHETNALESELQVLKMDKEKQAVYIRELEQKNDDLERGQRVISESVSYIETLLNQAYERNAVLESEVDEIENLKVRLQRATDEARDLKQELIVVEKVPHKKEDECANDNTTIMNGHSTRSQVETETQTILSATQKREINGNALTPSSRVSAMNIVGDILRKVGLERFLCRECGKVKCSCEETQPAPGEHAVLTQTVSIHNESNHLDTEVEYRDHNVLSRRFSGPQQSDLDTNIIKPSLSHRNSEQPFSRTQENGKLRRSFAVRSREGIENLLSFASIRKAHDQNRANKLLKK